MNLRSKVDGQPAYVLHTYPFRETSLIVEIFPATSDAWRCWHAALVGQGPRFAAC